MINAPDRQEAIALINEAVAAGSRRRLACREIGITVLRVVNEPRFASLPPTQIVPILADEGRYLASESTFYRILREADQLARRGRARTPHARSVPRHRATGPNQLYAWDITYLPGPVAGMFFFLYLMLGVFSRKIVAHEVHAAESAELAAQLIEQAVRREGVPHGVLVVHQDNGSPMKGSTYVVKLVELGVRPSYSRPGVSDDNAYAESLFRTCKYRPGFPGQPGHRYLVAEHPANHRLPAFQ